MTTKADLRAAILSDSHRPDLTGEVDRFIRQGEGMIRRDLTAYELSVTLTDADRAVGVESPIYNLPPRTLIVRRIQPTTQGRGLTRVALDAIGSYALTDRVHSYAQTDQTVELRGNPATGAEFTVNYYGSPEPLEADTDTNTLLQDHESLYQASALFFLYNHTQDRELASDQLSIFENVITTLNEAYSRKIGGAKVTQSYHYGGGSAY